VYTHKSYVDTINGVIKNGKLFTNDEVEKKYHMAGKYYLLKASSLRVNNLEGGDYIEYDLCRQKTDL
jgi:hypothetical protein